MGWGSRYKTCSDGSRSEQWFEYIMTHPNWNAVITNDDLSLEEARRIEKLYILKYGRIDIGTGILINKNNGCDFCITNNIIEP